MLFKQRRHATIGVALVTAVLRLGCHSAFAQAPSPPPPPPGPGLWEGTAGAGLALTSGNSDTLTFNLAFDATRAPKTRNVLKMKGLFLRGSEGGDLVTNRLSFTFRDQYALTPRTFVYGQFDYPRDTFTQIDYLIAPTAGIGYKVVDSPRTKFAVDAGVGAVWEKNPGLDVDASFVISAGSDRFALTCDLLDTFKNNPPTPETKKNDVALVTAIAAKF